MKKKKVYFFAIASILCSALLFPHLIFAKPKEPSRIFVEKTKDNRYKLMVDKKPYIVKGVCYSPIPIGQSIDYDFWSDPNKPWKIDGQLMKDMGVNTVRFYEAGENPQTVRVVIDDLFNLYGIRTMMGHWLGFWEYSGTRYADEGFREKAKKEVLDMVNAYKDNAGILFWVLGNENNYSFSGRVNPWTSDEIDKLEDIRKRIDMRARIYYSFVNDLAREIHKIDPNHPVVLGNGELAHLELANELCPDIDIVGCVIYRGKSFGNIFRNLRNTFDKPIVFIEFGADSYDAHKKQEDQNMQSYFLESQWIEIYKNLYDYKDGEGNCLGGAIFEWNDEWWKHNEYACDMWSVQDTESNWSNGAYYFDIKAEGNKNMNEEWFGLVALSKDGDGKLDKRIARKAYYALREFWKNPRKKIYEIKNNNKNNQGK